MTSETTGLAVKKAGIFSEVGSLVGLAIPVVLGLATSTAPALIDTFMLGGLGGTVLASVSVTSSIILVFYAGLYGLMVPLGVMIGQAYGANESDNVGELVRDGFVVSFVAGLLSVGVMLGILPFLDALGQPEAVIEIVEPYWIFMGLSLLPYVLSLVFKQLYDSIDRPWAGFLFTIVAVVANVLVNWVLIYGNLGFPALGLLGAGIGSFVAQCVALFIMFAYYRVSVSLAPYRKLKDSSWSGLGIQMREGTPVAFQYLMETAAVAVAGIMIGWVSTNDLAANQIVSSVSSVLFMLPLGMATAVSVRVAQARGAENDDRLPKIAQTGLAIVTGFTVLFTIFLLVFGSEIASIFVDEQTVIAIASTAFIVVAVMQIFDGLQSVSLGALRGILDNDYPTLVSLIGYWLIALPAAYYGGIVLEGGVSGVWAGFAVGLVFASILLLRRVYKQL